jgi:hypothetical protein
LKSPEAYRTKDDDATAYRFAVGRITIDPRECQDLDIEIEAFTIHECMVPEPRGYSLPLHAVL